MTTDDPPNKHQPDTIDDELAHFRANLRSLDGEIAKTQKHPLKLQAKRASSQNSADELGSAHIRRLPTELLVRVFMLTLPMEPSLCHPGAAPLVLGQVCRSWRAVSRSTPLLWSTIRIEAIKTEEYRVAVLEWLERSCRCPLTVYVEPDGPKWEILAGIAARIAHLDIEVDHDEVGQLFSSDGCDSLDSLQSLHIEITDCWECDFEGLQVDLGIRAPQLARVYVGGGPTFQHLILPSIQITICDICVGDTTSFMLFFQEAVNLVDCTITVGDFLRVDVSPRSPVRHTKLEKLNIQDFQDTNRNVLASILPCMDLASLREFRWDNRDIFGQYGQDWPIAIFLDFLSRSGCTLSTLWIGCGPADDDILQYLLEVPSVVDLAINLGMHCTCSRKLMRALTLGSHSEPEGKYLVPNVEHLRICGAWSQCEEMMQAIESRFGAVGYTPEGKRLKRVSLVPSLVYNNRLGHTQGRLDKCVREGLLYDLDFSVE
ncbi:hypothetical protein FIBSPDRAFT_1049659 [Athelia psychrophila]|uniref:F-box domain-containing protein n=1 Tax=Athelia psychrophila TaxID=1759441 RepID=A0A166BY08_9AGAM|nr:hypothetical protein FIBSPDRAFT_1049659 [Fibularhizoctonia sp. CBS 109695]